MRHSVYPTFCAFAVLALSACGAGAPPTGPYGEGVAAPSAPAAARPLDIGRCRSGNDCAAGLACVLDDAATGTCLAPGPQDDGSTVADPAAGTGLLAGERGRPLPPVGLLDGSAHRARVGR